jgi:hypothetical protein
VNAIHKLSMNKSGMRILTREYELLVFYTLETKAQTAVTNLFTTSGHARSVNLTLVSSYL